MYALGIPIWPTTDLIYRLKVEMSDSKTQYASSEAGVRFGSAGESVVLQIRRHRISALNGLCIHIGALLLGLIIYVKGCIEVGENPVCIQ